MGSGICGFPARLGGIRLEEARGHGAESTFDAGGFGGRGSRIVTVAVVVVFFWVAFAGRGGRVLEGWHGVVFYENLGGLFRVVCVCVCVSTGFFVGWYSYNTLKLTFSIGIVCFTCFFSQFAICIFCRIHFEAAFLGLEDVQGHQLEHTLS